MPNPENLIGWDFKTKHVDPSIFGENRDFASSESIVFCVGPPHGVFAGADFYPIGVLENASVGQNKQIQQLFEIGSRLPYFIPGRTITQLGLTRVFLSGANLLKYLTLGAMRYESDATDMPKKPGQPYEATAGIPDWTEPTYWDNQNRDSWFFINLASEFFNRPIGIALVIQDSEGDDYGGAYFKDCYIQSHNFTVAAAQTVVMENATIRCSEVDPIKFYPGSS